jgi:hypothetical protein
MKPLTFKGFLRKYVLELSACKSYSLSKLAQEAERQNARLREPLLLFAILTHDGNTLLRLLNKNKKIINDYNQYFLRCKNAESILKAFEHNSDSLPLSYQKVYNSYLSEKNRFLSDSHTKSLMKKKIVNLQKEMKLTDYRLYTDLHLNSGNFNAFMKHDRMDRLSLESTRRILKHLENFQFKNSLERRNKTI